jgi:putative FmdB family regulatory protein
MPIYEYWCTKCGKEFEQMRPMSQSGEPGTCPTCGSKAEKMPSVFASKENYTIKVPRGPAFRQRATGTASAPATVASPGKKASAAKPAAKSAQKSGVKAASASSGAKAGAKAGAGRAKK